MRTFLTAVFILALVPSTAHAQWGPSFGMLMGKFDSNDLSFVDKFVEQATGYDTEVKGRFWDICAAHGGTGSSVTRFCYTRVPIENHSGFHEFDFDAYTQDVAVKGFKVEHIWRLAPSRWPVSPTVNLHGGLGKITGNVDFTAYSVTPDSSSPSGFTRDGDTVLYQERRPVTEFWPKFGNDWTFLMGAGIGVSADISQKATVNFGIYGMEFPGVYKAGLLQVTFWP